MPLTFDWTNTDLSTDSDNDKALADAAVWATMAVGINHVTAANAREFYARVSLWERVTGPYRQRIDHDTNRVVDEYFTADDVVRLIGMRTNASTLTKTQFHKHVWDTHERFNVPKSLDTASPVV